LVDRQLAGRLLESQPRYHIEYACDGLEALELVEARLPLALVTDLHMPAMDGVELIDVMRRNFSRVPIVVMTAHGSEDVALQALTLGAADYVPKSHLVSELRKAVDGVLAITTGERTHQRLSQYLRRQELHYDLENDPRLILPLADELQRAAVDLGAVDESDCVRLAKALVEALRNAMYHGSPERHQAPAEPAGEVPPSATETAIPQRDQPLQDGRRIHVQAVLSPEEARFTIRDEGPGFDVTGLPNIKSDPSRLAGGGGHGLVLIQMFMDEVSFNAAGNEITMLKRRKGAAKKVMVGELQAFSNRHSE
jgi:CheY-like chemotaxis protein